MPWRKYLGSVDYVVGALPLATNANDQEERDDYLAKVKPVKEQTTGSVAAHF
jgi:hypothetical protein